MILDIFDSMTDSEPRVVSNAATTDEIEHAVQNQSWEGITFVTLHADNGDLLECSGSHEDGFSGRYVENGSEHFSINPPTSTDEMNGLLQSYASGDEQWRTLLDWD